MKFTSILTTALFSLFVLAATTTFAAEIPSIETNHQILADEVIIMTGRTAQVSDKTSRLMPNFSMVVEVKQGNDTILRRQFNQPNATLDLDELSVGMYIIVVKTPTEIHEKIVTLK